MRNLSLPTNHGKYPVKLKEDAFHRVIDAFVKKTHHRVLYPLQNEVTYGDALIYQAVTFGR
jgi:hypothetical protein